MSFLHKLTSGLSKSSGKLSGGITGIFTQARLDDAAVEQFEELLIEADMGVKTAAQLAAKLAQQKFDKDVTPEAVKRFLADEVTRILEPLAVPFAPDASHRPAVVMMVGVNGNGKTTTIGKLAHRFKREGKTVMLAAADTFRAAAVEQLQVWGERAGIPVVTGALNSDPASVAFAALEKARAVNIDILFIDTAGRLQNKTGLMEELAKMSRVLKKLDDSAPHHVLQVLDATTGQNAVSQLQAFRDMVQVTGLIVTKLDGTAKGGVVVALAEAFGLPIHAVGVGEGTDDLDNFQAADFAYNLVGLPAD